jgi:hypothetical protein
MSVCLVQNDRIVTAVKTLAVSDPDYLPFLEQHQELFFNHAPPDVETELRCDLLALLQEMPDRSTQLAQLSKSTERSAFDGGAATVSLLFAAAFLLRTHLRIKRSGGGKWEFLVEHKPGDSQLVNQLLTKVARLLFRHRPSPAAR